MNSTTFEPEDAARQWAAEGGAQAEAGPEANGRRKRENIRLVLIGIFILGAIGAIIWYIDYDRRGQYLEATNDAFIQADTVTISPKIAGYIEHVFVRDNQDVKIGAPLFKIDPLDYQAQASQYQAQIELSRASADNARAQIGEQRALIQQAEAQLAAARSTADFATAEVARYGPLAASGAETREQLARLRNEASKAVAALTQQKAIVLSARRRLETLASQVAQAHAQERSAKAQWSGASGNVNATLVRASISGRIGDKQARAGQYVQPGARLTTIVPLAQLYVEANFKETQLGLMRVGQPVEIEVDALPGVTLHGHVASLSPGTGAQFSVLPPQNATGNFTKIVQRVPVRIAVDAGPQTRSLLIPGMSVEVRVNTISAKGTKERIEREQANRKRAKR